MLRREALSRDRLVGIWHLRKLIFARRGQSD
jgi:hypothetical protein